VSPFVIPQAVLYLAVPDDARAALLTVAGWPVAFRALMAAVRAGATRVGLPASFRGTALERAIAGVPAARAAAVWLEAGSEAPAEPALLVPAAALAPATAMRELLDGPVPAVLTESAGSDAPVVAASGALVRSLWGRLAAGEPVGAVLGDALGAGGVADRAAAGWYVRVATPAAAVAAEARLYTQLGSPLDTRLDTALHRRLSRLVTRGAVAAGLTPNVVTGASLLVGVIAAWCFWRGSPASALAGFGLYAASTVLDHADGEVARLTLTESALGEWLDIVADTLVHALIVLALGLTVERLVGGGGAVLGTVAAVGVGAGAALAKISPPPASAAGVVLHGLSNRNGFYAMLAGFILALAWLPAALPALMLVVAVGMHAFWLGHVVYRVARRRPESAAG